MAQTLQIKMLMLLQHYVKNQLQSSVILSLSLTRFLVPLKDRSLLRFLWWENHDTSGKMLNFEMNIHVFRGTSSPSCCNYALKKTAFDNKTNYHPDVVLALNSSLFY